MKRNLVTVANEGNLDKLLSLKDAAVLAKETGKSILCNQGWPEEITGKEKRITINKDNLSKIASAVVCLKNSFPTRIPLTYKVECGW